MNDSWIAVADPHGLKLLVLETKLALRSATQRAERENSECFWVVLQPRHAEKVNQQLQIGNATAALWMLEHLALHAGRIDPSQPDIPDMEPDDVTITDDHDMEWTN